MPPASNRPAISRAIPSALPRSARRSNISLALVLEKHNIAIKDVRIIGLQSNSNVASSLIGGQIDGAIMSSANLYAVVNRNGGKFLSWLDDEVHGAAVSGTVASTKIANARPETVRHFLAAFRKGAQVLDAAFVDANGNRADQPNAQEMIDDCERPQTAGQRHRSAPGLCGPRSAHRGQRRPADARLYQAMGMQKTHIDAKAIIDMRYAKLLDRPASDQ